jgi:hypothetical protein
VTNLVAHYKDVTLEMKAKTPWDHRQDDVPSEAIAELQTRPPARRANRQSRQRPFSRRNRQAHFAVQRTPMKISTSISIR